MKSIVLPEEDVATVLRGSSECVSISHLLASRHEFHPATHQLYHFTASQDVSSGGMTVMSLIFTTNRRLEKVNWLILGSGPPGKVPPEHPTDLWLWLSRAIGLGGMVWLAVLALKPRV